MIRDGVMPQSDGRNPSDSHKEDIWERKSVRKIMKESRRRFNESKAKGNHTEAHIQRASDHYSVVKQYLAPAPRWMRIIAVWHMWRARAHVKKAIGFGLQNADQIDVASRILTKAPWWLGGNKAEAANLIEGALGIGPTSLDSLNHKPMEMAPHTRALLLVTLAQILCEEYSNWDYVFEYLGSAINLEKEILQEPDYKMALRQWVRILHGAAVIFLEYGIKNDEWGRASYGMELLDKALLLAMRVSKDQEAKILADADRFKKMIHAYQRELEAARTAEAKRKANNS